MHNTVRYAGTEVTGKVQPTAIDGRQHIVHTYLAAHRTTIISPGCTDGATYHAWPMVNLWNRSMSRTLWVDTQPQRSLNVATMMHTCGSSIHVHVKCHPNKYHKHTRTHTLTHTHTHMHTHTHADTHTNTVHIHAHSCTHTHTLAHTHAHTKTCTCMVMGTVCTTYILTVLACMEELRCPLTPLVTLHTWKGLGAGWHKHKQEDLHWIHPLWQVCVHKKLLIKRHRLREEEIKLIIKASY